jgi:hypothetical protein
LKGLLVTSVMVATLVAASGTPVVAANSRARVRLAVLPLPASMIGSAAKSLRIQADSGATSNKDAARRGLFLTPTHSLAASPAKAFIRLGRIVGYVLDYGLGASGGAGVTEVWTSVDRYKTSADAKKGLTHWKDVDRHGLTEFDHGEGLGVSHHVERVAAVGNWRFAFFIGFRAPNIAPVFGVDEEFTEGRYEAAVIVWAGTAERAKDLAPTLARKLDGRIKRALAGRLHTTPVKLPATRKPGPPDGGPDLAALALKTSDLSGAATLVGQLYLDDPLNPTALSDLDVAMNPAGPFGQLVQEIEWCPTANQASFIADFWAANGLSGSGATQLDLGSVGDGAHGLIAQTSSGGEAEVVLSSGQLMEILYVASQNPVRVSDVQSVAQTAANYINAAGLGS